MSATLACSILNEPFPEADPSLLVEDTVTCVIQIKGKVRDRVEVTKELPVWATTVDIAVHHFDAEDRANTMLEQLEQQVPRDGQRQIVEIGAVVGAQTGPGIVAVAISPYPARMED